MKKEDLKEFLDEKFDQYHKEEFIESDPIQIPRSFQKKEDIEIAAFMSATIAWGQRKSIIKNAKSLVERMDYSPHDFILNAKDSDLEIFRDFKHRTFNGDDCIFFIKSLQNIYTNHTGLENVFAEGIAKGNGMYGGLAHFRDVFFSIEHLHRTEKHVSNVLKNSAAKRLNMFLRWMIRSNDRNVDFGLWKNISASELYLPLDVHTARVGRRLELLSRKQNDWKAVAEITENLRSMDPKDPVKYDFALFGLGVFEKF